MSVIRRDDEPTPAARAIGAKLAESPPNGYRDRFSAEGWAVIADAVLQASGAVEELADERRKADEAVADLRALIAEQAEEIARLRRGQ